MNDTKARILEAALRLFAESGYEAVSTSAIAAELGMTKSALYKHYQSKRDIFEQILARMEELDRSGAQAFSLPEEPAFASPGAYALPSFEGLSQYCKEQFDYWTRQPFPARFRRLLTLEQYRSEEMSRLFAQYLSSGPVEYLAALFAASTHCSGEASFSLALELYGPMYLLYGVSDGAADKDAVRALAYAQIDDFFKRTKEN